MGDEVKVDKKSIVKMVKNTLAMIRYAIAGAMGAIAIVDVLGDAVQSVALTPTATNVAGVVGAVLMTGAAKAAHLI